MAPAADMSEAGGTLDLTLQLHLGTGHPTPAAYFEMTCSRERPNQRFYLDNADTF